MAPRAGLELDTGGSRDVPNETLVQADKAEEHAASLEDWPLQDCAGRLSPPAHHGAPKPKLPATAQAATTATTEFVGVRRTRMEAEAAESEADEMAVKQVKVAVKCEKDQPETTQAGGHLARKPAESEADEMAVRQRTVAVNYEKDLSVFLQAGGHAARKVPKAGGGIVARSKTFKTPVFNSMSLLSSGEAASKQHRGGRGGLPEPGRPRELHPINFFLTKSGTETSGVPPTSHLGSRYGRRRGGSLGGLEARSNPILSDLQRFEDEDEDIGDYGFGPPCSNLPMLAARSKIGAAVKQGAQGGGNGNLDSGARRNPILKELERWEAWEGRQRAKAQSALESSHFDGGSQTGPVCLTDKEPNEVMGRETEASWQQQGCMAPGIGATLSLSQMKRVLPKPPTRLAPEYAPLSASSSKYSHNSKYNVQDVTFSRCFEA